MINFENGLQIYLESPDATAAFASSVALSLYPKTIIYLHGDLGAGKTTFVRGMLSALGYKGKAKSPSFALVERYKLDKLEMDHFDLYRLANPAELDFIGIRDYIASPAVIIFEWADKGLGAIPLADIEITLEIKEEGRSATLIGNTPLGLKTLRDIVVGNQ